ncbi:cysteine synthase [Sulfolobales archaeon HS-7]|nr:cysteine synthase [Sulfolobales archaeon HS-7]
MWPTPLLKLDIGPNVWAKLEFFNPFSRSIKDRTAYFLIKNEIEKGRNRFIEASSGNLALALASLASIYKFEFTPFIPSTSSRFFKVALKILGIRYVEYGNKTTEIVPLAKKYAELTEAANLDQFTNERNPNAHFTTSAREILEQLGSVGKFPERIFASVGTGGHITGLYRFFKQFDKKVEVVAVQPKEGSKIPGMKRIDESGFAEVKSIQKVIDVSEGEALAGVQLIARRNGILVGLSAGATVSAFLKIMDERTTVLIFPDDLFKYIDEVEKLLENEATSNSK